MTIGQRIRQRRLELNMSQEDLAKRMGYSTRNAIYQFEKRDNMKLSLIEKFADALDTTPAYLMGWEGEESQPTIHEHSEPANSRNDEDEQLLKDYHSVSSEVRKTIDLLIEADLLKRGLKG